MEGLLKNTLAYGMAPGTSFHCRNDGIYLVLNYPLKFTTLHYAWHPLFQALADRSMIRLEQIDAILRDMPVKKIADLLDQLVYKGFLVRSGNEGLDDFPLVSVIIPVRNRPKEIPNKPATSLSV